MSAALVISLDFELYWGIHGTRTLDSYARSLAGVRQAIDGMLGLFNAFGVNATWATVGFLFFDGPDDLNRHRPQILPGYTDETRCPYAHLDRAGDELIRDFHFAPEVIRKIVESPGQELGTHTFSHFACLEAPQNIEAFRSDLIAVAAVSQERVGHRPTSLVFPTNQYSDAHLAVAAELGITAYRGTPSSGIHAGRPRGVEPAHARVGRLVDSYLPITHDQATVPTLTMPGLVNVPSSRFLRPWTPKFAWAERARIGRIAFEMRTAAANGSAYHLWWHPHNFGLHTNANLLGLRQILEVFDELRRTRGMQSQRMCDVARHVLQLPPPVGPAPD